MGSGAEGALKRRIEEVWTDNRGTGAVVPDPMPSGVLAPLLRQ